jgi:hypothetical protein
MSNNRPIACVAREAGPPPRLGPLEALLLEPFPGEGVRDNSRTGFWASRAVGHLSKLPADMPLAGSSVPGTSGTSRSDASRVTPAIPRGDPKRGAWQVDHSR